MLYIPLRTKLLHLHTRHFGGHGAPGGPDGPAQPLAAVGSLQTTFAVLNKCHARETGENEAWQEFLSVGAYVYLYP